MDSNRIVTKHCSEKVRNFILQGHVRIGTLADYRDNEASGALLSDSSEGRGQKIVMQDVHNFYGNLGSNVFENCSMTGNGRGAISLGVEVNYNVFCCSDGPFNSTRHQNIRIGNVEYGSNPELTHYLEFDKRRLRLALTSALREHYRCATVHTIGCKVAYGDRDKYLGENEAHVEFSPDSMKSYAFELVHQKPSKYALEEEYRFAFNSPTFSPQVIMTSSLSLNTQRRIIEAIIQIR